MRFLQGRVRWLLFLLLFLVGQAFQSVAFAQSIGITGGINSGSAAAGGGAAVSSVSVPTAMTSTKNGLGAVTLAFSGQACDAAHSPCTVTSGVLNGNAVSAAIQFNLPVAAGTQQQILACKTDASPNTVTLHRNGSDQIDAAATDYTLAGQYQCVTLIDYAAGNWATSSERASGGVGTGTVTSVGLSASPDFTGGAPVTTAGNLTLAHSGQICTFATSPCPVTAGELVGNATAGTVEFDLPVTNATYNPIEACKSDASANTVTLHRNGSDTISGAASDYMLIAQHQCVKLVDTSAGNWSIRSERWAAIPSANLAATGVVAGTYTNTNLTVNAQGQITTASSGPGGGTGPSPAGSTGNLQTNGGGGSLGAYGGASCTNKALSALDSSGNGTCNTITSNYVDTSIAKTGTDINTSNQVTNGSHITNASIPSTGIAATGVAQGSYTCTSLTVNAAGQITSASTGSCSGGGGGTIYGTTHSLPTGSPPAPTCGATSGTNSSLDTYAGNIASNNYNPNLPSNCINHDRIYYLYEQGGTPYIAHQPTFTATGVTNGVVYAGPGTGCPSLGGTTGNLQLYQLMYDATGVQWLQTCGAIMQPNAAAVFNQAGTGLTGSGNIVSIATGGLRQGLYTTPGGGTNLTTGNFMPGSGVGSQTTEANVASVAPMAMTFKNLNCQVTAAPTSTNSWTFIFRVNGATPTSEPTCTVTGLATSCSDTSDSATISPGGTFDVEITSSGSPAAAKGSCGYEADI